MSEKDLHELLNLMRRMYCAAQQGRWDAVNELDIERNGIFATIGGDAAAATFATRAAVSEIIELDHAVLNLANLGMKQIAAQTSFETSIDPSVQTSVQIGDQASDQSKAL